MWMWHSSTLGFRNVFHRRRSGLVHIPSLIESRVSPGSGGKGSWGQTFDIISQGRKPQPVDGTVCALGEIEQLCASTQRLSQCKAKVQFNSLTILSKLHFVCCREFQTEYLLCDCNILWMHRWVKERNVTVRDTRCVYPKSLQAQPVTGVKQELLTCGKEEKLRKGQLCFTCCHVLPDKLRNSFYTLELIVAISLHEFDSI